VQADIDIAAQKRINRFTQKRLSGAGACFVRQLARWREWPSPSAELSVVAIAPRFVGF
jgi:hypothetical protein